MINRCRFGAFNALSITGSIVGCLLVLFLLGSVSFAQQLTGTLTGTVYDSAGAVVPNAKVTMKNEASGDIRTTVSNGSGYFTITAVQPGSYSVSIEATGFKTWERTGIAFAQGDSHTLANIKLEVGQVSETVEIRAGADVVIPDNAEVSTTLNQQLVQDTPIFGRDAGELLKLMPGMANNNGLTQGSNFNPKVVSSNTGPVGSYSANGTQPNGAMAFMLDGANLVDPGNAGTQIANINQDMVSEVKVLMSNYSAEYAKGPVIFQAFSKSGGNQFHGEGYLYTRNSIFNSWDSYSKTQYLNDKLTVKDPGALAADLSALKPDEHYYYMGGNLGGPIPFLNRGKQKVFFWGGYEYMIQHPAGIPVNYNVPTAEQMGFKTPGIADFSNTTINGIPGSTPVSGCGGHGTLVQCLQNVWQYSYNNPYGLPGGGNTMPLAGNLDPNLAGLGGISSPCTGGKTGCFYPTANIVPSQYNGWNNYQYVNNAPQNRWEATGKVDYSISDNSKLAVSYTRQIETDQHPVGVWWTPPWTLPYPSNVAANTTSQEIMANFTHVFSPTTTNEAVFTLARYVNPSTLSTPSAVDRTKLGFNVQGLYGHTSKQIPNILGPWGGAFPNIEEFSFDGTFNGGAFGAEKRDPAIYDNFTKVVGEHTLKAGFYWDTSDNIQSAGGLAPGDNGTYNLGWGPNSSGNLVADFLLGRTANYQQVSSYPTFDIKFHQWSIYAQDSYKANRQLTVNYGLRFDHMGQMYGPPNGMAVWNPASYDNTPAAGANTGLLWHSINSSIPLSGLQSPLFYYEPRVGIAYDVFGTGKTVLRGGIAWFRYQLAVNDVGGATNLASGVFTAQSPGTQTGYGQINQPGFYTPPPTSSASQYVSGSSAGASISPFVQGDNRTPYVMDYNITISQALPWRSVFEVSYVGNKSYNELINGGNSGINNINTPGFGAYYLKDPLVLVGGSPASVSTNPPTCNSTTAGDDYAFCSSFPQYAIQNGQGGFDGNHFRPLKNYSDVFLISHGSYASYNSLQASWQKQSGPINFLMNYTFSKVMGIRDGQTDNGNGNGTATSPILQQNYAPLAYDHTHIVNGSFVWNLPKFIHGHHFVEGAVNGWQLSGYTTYQSGAPIQPNTGGNLNANFPGLTYPTQGAPDLPDNMILLPNGLESTNVNIQTWLGSGGSGGNTGSGYHNLVPQVTCDPRKHASGAYFNPACFTVPAFGTPGTMVWPYIKGPAFFDSDLAIFKNFQVTERQKVQFRLSVTNWLNHPLPQFGLAGNADESLNFTNSYTVPISNTATGSQGNECAFLNLTPDSSGFCHANVTGISLANTNFVTTGKPTFKAGYRTLLFSVKYFF